MNSKHFLQTLDKRAAEETSKNSKLQEQQSSTQNTQAVIDTIETAIIQLMKFTAQHKPQVIVTNQKLPTSVKTPDIEKVVKALENLKQPLQENKPDDTRVVDAIAQLTTAVSKLPTSFPELPKPLDTVTVKNQPDYSKDFQKLSDSISKIDVKPVVNVEDKPDDYTPITDSLQSVVKAVQSIKFPTVPELNLEPLISAVGAVQDAVVNQKFPVPNYVLPFKDADGKATQVQLNADGTLPTSGGSGGGTVNQGTAGVDPWLTIDEDKQDVLAYAHTLTTGDTITPSTGKQLKILKSQILQNPINATFSLVTLSFASSIGDFFKCWAGSDSSVWVGGVDEVLTIGVSSSDPVSVNIRYKEL